MIVVVIVLIVALIFTAGMYFHCRIVRDEIKKASNVSARPSTPPEPSGKQGQVRILKPTPIKNSSEGIESSRYFIYIDYDNNRDGFIVETDNGIKLFSEYLSSWRYVPSFKNVKNNYLIREILKITYLKAAIKDTSDTHRYYSYDIIQPHSLKKYIEKNGRINIPEHPTDSYLDINFYEKRMNVNRSIDLKNKSKIKSRKGY